MRAGANQVGQDTTIGWTTWIGWLFASVMTAIGAFWGEVDPWLKALFFLSLLDAGAGVWRAKVTGTFVFSLASAGLDKKVMMAMLITATLILQYYVSLLVGYNTPLTTAVAGFYIAKEFLSILRHARAGGVEIPQQVVDFGERIEQFSEGRKNPGPEPSNKGFR